MKADLHIHTHFSDGLVSPAEVVSRAARSGLDFIAVTDHDTLGPWQAVEAECASRGLRTLPAAEFTSSLHGQEIHLLGYFPSMPGPVVTEHLASVQAFRRERMQRAVLRLRARGVSVEFEELPFHEQCQSLTGAHLARCLLSKGFARSIRGVWRREAVRNALGGFEFTAEEVIEVIHRGGGVAVWAHPARKRFRRRLQELLALGLDGIEGVNFRRNDALDREYIAEAEKFGLLVTGGSDWHEGPGLGENSVDEEVLAAFLERMERTPGPAGRIQ